MKRLVRNFLCTLGILVVAGSFAGCDSMSNWAGFSGWGSHFHGGAIKNTCAAPAPMPVYTKGGVGPNYTK